MRTLALLLVLFAGCPAIPKDPEQAELVRQQRIALLETGWATAQAILATIDKDAIGPDGWKAVEVAREAVEVAIARVKASPDADAFVVALEAYGAALRKFVEVTAPRPE